MKQSLIKKLDKLVGSWCIKERSGGKCEKCGNKKSLEWCHIKTRNIHSVRWSLNNCVCLCDTCHKHFHNNIDEFMYWLQDYYPEQLSKLSIEYNDLSFRDNDIYGETLLKELPIKISSFINEN